MSKTDPTKEELYTTLHRNDRLWRIFQSIFTALVFFALAGVIVIQARTLEGVRTQLSNQQKTVSEIKNNTQKQLDTVNRHLDCIIVYFAQPNRATLTIQDINKCTLQNSTGVQQFFTTPQGTNVAPSSLQSPSTPSSTGGQTVTPSNTTPTTPTQPTAPADPVQPQPNPLEVLGIPVCVPFTGVCVR